MHIVAMRRLRASHGFSFMTAPNLKKILALLRLRRQHLVGQGLALERLFRGEQGPVHAVTVVNGSVENEGQIVTATVEFDTADCDNTKSDNDPESDHDNLEIFVHFLGDVEQGPNGEVDRSHKRSRHPPHAAMLAHGIGIHPRELQAVTQRRRRGPSPLLWASRVGKPFPPGFQRASSRA